ncbi:hypothetical protein M9458_027569, partial [Cirrhinus mrigala]
GWMGSRRTSRRSPLTQGMERKKVMQHIRGLYKTDLSASRHWQELVQQLTHDRSDSLSASDSPTKIVYSFPHVVSNLYDVIVFPWNRAVWYDQSSYPTSWQLDPTEGPNRERRRLQRCYLTIPNKYLLKDRHKLDGEIQHL